MMAKIVLALFLKDYIETKKIMKNIVLWLLSHTVTIIYLHPNTLILSSVQPLTKNYFILRGHFKNTYLINREGWNQNDNVWWRWGRRRGWKWWLQKYNREDKLWVLARGQRSSLPFLPQEIKPNPEHITLEQNFNIFGQTNLRLFVFWWICDLDLKIFQWLFSTTGKCSCG